MGLVGVFSYVGAAIQESVSAALISNGAVLADGTKGYDFDLAIVFWIGSSVASMLLAASLWNARTRS
jgi:OPA family sugar phosphate sensor protein UhpC-like MFS transporter